MLSMLQVLERLFCYVITWDREMVVGWGVVEKGDSQERVQNLFCYTLLTSNFFEIDFAIQTK